MITKNDCVLLLTEIQKEKEIDTSQYISNLYKQTNIPIEIIKFINDNRQLDVTAFYERIRKSYNNRKSNLYINIVREVKDDPTIAVTTLSAMLTQILLFSKNLENKQMFLRQARAEEISFVLLNYFKSYDITNCYKLLRLIRADIKALEYINGRDI